MTLTASDLLNEISQYEIGNIDKIFTEKDLKKRFSKMDHSEIQSFLLSCGAQFSEIKNHPILNDEEKTTKIETDYILSFFGLNMKLGPITEWGLNMDKKKKLLQNYIVKFI